VSVATLLRSIPTVLTVPPGRDPEVVWRRGPPKDSTAPRPRQGLGRSESYTPQEYRLGQLLSEPSPTHPVRGRLTLAASRSYNPPADAPKRLRAPGAFACLSGYPDPEAEWRDTRRPMKQTYQPKKRHRAKEHGFRARMKTTGGRACWPRAAPMAARSSRSDGGPRPQLAAAGMLSSPEDFAALQGQGSVRSNPLLVVRIRRTDLEEARFGFSTGRKLGGAVVRNRVRRRLREALRVMAPSFQTGWTSLSSPDRPLSQQTSKR